MQVAQFAAVCLEVLRAYPNILGPERTAQLSGPVFSTAQSSEDSTEPYYEPDVIDAATAGPPLLTRLSRPRTFFALTRACTLRQRAGEPEELAHKVAQIPIASSEPVPSPSSSELNHISSSTLNGFERSTVSSASASVSSTTLQSTPPFASSAQIAGLHSSRIEHRAATETTSSSKLPSATATKTDNSDQNATSSSENSDQNALQVDESRPIICAHCTHGFNRTGYFIVRFLVDILGME